MNDKKEIVNGNNEIDEAIMRFDEDIRQEFSRVFNWYEEHTGYTPNDPKILSKPTWAEIHCKIGKLLAKEEESEEPKAERDKL